MRVQRRPAHLALLALLVVAGIYLCSFLLLPSAGFWINDNGSKFIQLRAIVAGGYRDYSIALPGRAVDPDLEYNPLLPPSFHVQGKKLYCQYSLAFALLSSFPQRLFGQRGLYFLPLLASLLMLAGCGRLARLLGGDATASAAAVLLAGLATPTWFYSQTFWEHTSAACLVVWGLYHLLRSLPAGDSRRIFLGSLLLALAVSFRDELYLFWPLAVGTVLLRAKARRAAAALAAVAGGAAGILPLLALQGAALGSILGFHVENSLPVSGLAPYLASRPRVFYELYLALGAHPALSLALTAPFLAATFFGSRLARRSAALPVIAVLGALAGLVLLGGFRSGATMMPWLMASNSLWPAAPVIVLASLAIPSAGEGDRRRAALLQLALVYALLYGLASPAWRTQGLHWGNRLLFVLYPLLAVPAGITLVAAWRAPGAGRQVRRAALAALLVVSFAAQVYALGLLRDRMGLSMRLESAVRENPGEVVLTDLWWVPQELPNVVFERPVFYLRSPRALPGLLERLCRSGYRRTLFITRPGGGGVSAPHRRLEDPRFDFFAVDLLPGTTCRGD